VQADVHAPHYAINERNEKSSLAPIDERTLAFRAREQFIAWDRYKDALLGYDLLTGRDTRLPCATCRSLVGIEHLTAGPAATPLCPCCQALERGDLPPSGW
jgi:hypothetical protein